MDPVLKGILILVVTGLTVWAVSRRFRSETSSSTVSTGRLTTPSERLYQIAAGVYAPFEAAASPGDLLGFDGFEAGVQHLNAAGFTADDLLGYYQGDNAVLACLALEALARRSARRGLRGRLLEHVGNVVPWTRFFVLRALDSGEGCAEPIVARVLAVIDGRWDDPQSIRFLGDFVRRRVAGGERPVFGKLLERMAERQVSWLIGFLPRVDEASTRDLLQELRSWHGTMIDAEALEAIGRVLGPVVPAEAPVEHPDLLSTVARLEAEILRTPPRSFLLVGEHGVGKSAAIRVLATRLQGQGWTVFEAGRAELLAGMVYQGQLEGRLRELVGLIGRRPVLWVVPDFRALSWAGRREYDRTSVLDFLLPHIASGEVTVVGEITPGAWQRLLQAQPRCRTALQEVRLEPSEEPATLDLAARWAERLRPEGGEPILDAATLGEAWNLTQQFQGDRSAPGNLLELLGVTWRRLTAAGPAAPVRIGLDDLIRTLAQLTGLPMSILDEREQLDLAALRASFRERVMGQPEAVAALVERVAMIKAGVTDPTRPFGVFLFAGPTGTGKTEIAKVLAEFLFGSAERLVRLDMSELQDEPSLARLLGDRDEREDADSLTQLVRKEPFSVVLLDEFEKAHPKVWDLFLQVFDDGRLTDRQGRTTDFRHTLIVLTSNLGSEVPAGAGLGFQEREGSFNPQTVQRAIERALRKELLNRLDRIVVFRPLGRDTMRKILHRELDAVFRRRGLRNRSWAAEWDDSAIDFLLARGFTVDLGARPLRRAIERYLLTPLALTIVDHRFPEGDQFLFIRGDGDRLAVEFVDPDPAAVEASGPAGTAGAAGAGPTGRLEDVILHPHGSVEEVELLRARLGRLEQELASPALREAKRVALEFTADPEFWHSPERFSILGEAEYIDRIESGLDTARSLLARLGTLPGRGSDSVRRLLGRLAQQLWLLEHACADVREGRPHDAIVLVESGREAGATVLPGDEFAERIGAMYRSWSDRRGMRCEVLDERRGTEESPYRVTLSVSGYAAYHLLRDEAGLHVFEIPEGSRKPARRRVAHVHVVPQSESRPAVDGAALLAEAGPKLAAARQLPPQVVRRYRETPSPLVRDSRRGWRSGRLDRVLDGDFDLFAAAAGPTD